MKPNDSDYDGIISSKACLCVDNGMYVQLEIIEDCCLIITEFCSSNSHLANEFAAFCLKNLAKYEKRYQSIIYTYIESESKEDFKEELKNIYKDFIFNKGKQN